MHRKQRVGLGNAVHGAVHTVRHALCGTAPSTQRNHKKIWKLAWEGTTYNIELEIVYIRMENSVCEPSAISVKEKG